VKGVKTNLQEKTQAHYNRAPFDFLTQTSERAIRDIQPTPFREFVEQLLRPGDKVIDVGCGPGRATVFLVQEEMATFAVDLSVESIALAKKRSPASNYVCASNLDLPFPSGVFDAVVSDGVIHHTPDARRSFSENARLLVDGGYLYVGVYRRKGYYYYLYTYLGPTVRRLEREMLGRALIFLTIFPFYYLAHIIKSRGQRTWNGAKNFFYDYIITPQATFHTKEEICGWAADEGLELTLYEENVGNVHAFVFKKPKS
jgi:ubiquinone/menaquinone biosynthesis C-methylase UbiE